MKKLPKYIALIVSIFGVGGAFLVPNVFATTIYQQLTDSSQEIGLTACPAIGGHQTILAAFTVATPTTISTDSFFYGPIRNDDGGAQGSLSLQIATTSLFWGTNSALVTYVWPTVPTTTDDNFLEATYNSHTDNTLDPGVIYYLRGCHSGASDRFVLRTNYSSDFVYGYLTTDDTESLSLIPGAPGFTDFGIATTSQQTWCYQNFSTSTGLLDNIGASISTGICNVGVFLFIPSSNAIAQWQSLASSTAEKIPFSYVYEIYSDVSGLVATTTENLPTYEAPLADLTIGSTTSIGNILPNLTFLSAATIGTYLPAGIHDALFLLARAAIWVFTALILYSRIVPRKAKI